MKINDNVYVSDASGSRVSGCHGVVKQVRGDEIKVLTRDGVVGYARRKHVYVTAEVDELQFVEDVVPDPVPKYGIGQCVGFNSKIAIEYTAPHSNKTYTTQYMNAMITDAWVEDGVVLYNVVFYGDFRVIPESAIYTTIDAVAFV